MLIDMNVNRRDFLKTSTFLVRLLANPSAVAQLGESKPAKLIQELVGIQCDLEVDYLLNEHIRSLFGMRFGSNGEVPTESPLKPDNMTIGTYKTAKEIADTAPALVALKRGTLPKRLEALEAWVAGRKNHRKTLNERSLAILETLEKEGATHLPKGILSFGPSEISEEKGFIKSTIESCGKDTYWADFLEMAKSPSAQAIRTFIQKQYSWQYSHEQRDTLQAIAPKMGVKVDHNGMDTAEQAEANQRDAEERAREAEYQKKTMESYKQQKLIITQMEGNGDGEVESGIRIRSLDSSLYPLFEILADACSWQEKLSWPSVSEDYRTIAILNPTPAQMKLIEPLIKQAREHSHVANVTTQNDLPKPVQTSR